MGSCRRKRANKEKKRRSRKRNHHRDDSSSSSDSNDGEDTKVQQPLRRSLENRREERGKRKREGKTKLEDLLTPEQRTALEREKDLRERDEFVQRMLERDQKHTKQQMPLEKEEGDEADRKQIEREQRLLKGEQVLEDDGTEITLERLRMESRRAYLKKRQEREVTLLKQSLEDKEELFRSAKLTEAERKRIELGKKILSMVEKNEANDDRDDGFYRLPDEYNENETKANQEKTLLTSRYVEPRMEKSEQELWEQSQTQKAAIVSKKKKSAEEKEYDLILEDQIMTTQSKWKQMIPKKNGIIINIVVRRIPDQKHTIIATIIKSTTMMVSLMIRRTIMIMRMRMRTIMTRTSHS